MKKVLIIVLGLALLVLAVALARDRLRTDEERIWRRLDELAGSFDEGSPRGVMSGFAADFRDTTSGLDRTRLRAVLPWFFRDAREGEEGLRFRVRVIRDGAVLTVKEAAADLTVTLAFEERTGGVWSPIWRAEIEAELVRDGGDWLVRRSRYETLEGRRPF